MIDLVHHEARYIALLNRHMMRLLELELSPLELGPGRYLYLFALYVRDGRKQQDLADTIGVDKAAATRAIARLEENGYVRRRADRNDRRSTRVYLTPRGRNLRPRLESAATHCIETMTRNLDNRERLELGRLLAKITDAVTAEKQP